jgi:hypothetical protein
VSATCRSSNAAAALLPPRPSSTRPSAKPAVVKKGACR